MKRIIFSLMAIIAFAALSTAVYACSMGGHNAGNDMGHGAAIHDNTGHMDHPADMTVHHTDNHVQATESDQYQSGPQAEPESTVRQPMVNDDFHDDLEEMPHSHTHSGL